MVLTTATGSKLNQADTDGDGSGDSCDSDDDGDGCSRWRRQLSICCQLGSGWIPIHDGLGDACDSDKDGDGFADTVVNCPSVANSDQAGYRS